MCAYGAVIHGYKNSVIESAVDEQRKAVPCLIIHTVTVELAERLTEMIDFASWSVFAKRIRPHNLVTQEFRDIRGVLS